MPIKGLVYALLHAEDSRDEHTERLRDLSLSWSRFGYRDPILTGSSVDAILEEALALGYRACFVQAPGHVLCETWRPDHWGVPSLDQMVEEQLSQETLCFGSLAEDGAPRHLFVNLQQYQQKQQPPFSGFQVSPTPAGFDEHMADLQDVPQRFLGEGIVDLPETCPAELNAAQYRFLQSVALQLRCGQRGFFPINIEPYTDVDQPPENFVGPVSTLYCVAAGFKPNRILHSHGFDQNTKVVFFDYSQQALDIRRYMLENWDGADYPAFLSHLFEKFPHPETFYQLWAGRTPHNLEPDDLEIFWAAEVARWGGAEGFQQHWQAYRQVPHSFRLLSILSESEDLLKLMTGDSGEVIWWSNAFHSFYSNWLFPLAERRQGYLDWVARLAAVAPKCFVYGSDYANMSVNHIQAEPYRQVLNLHPHDHLSPLRLSGLEIRF